jgi:hypothetical protein
MSTKIRRNKIVFAVLLTALAIEAFAFTRASPPNSFNSVALDAFLHPDKALLYSIDPSPGESGSGPMFHGHRILEQAPLKEVQAIKAFEEIRTSARRWISSSRREEYACFDPRHGIRVSKNSQAFDLLICYECGKAVVYQARRNDTQALQSIYFEAAKKGPSPQTLNDILSVAGTAIPDE